MFTYVRAGRRAVALLEVGKLYGPHFFLQYGEPDSPKGSVMLDSADIERAVEALGFEVVQMERGGGRRRPLLRLPDRSAGSVVRAVGRDRRRLRRRDEGTAWRT